MNGLRYMVNSFQKADDIYKPSCFWQNINALHMEQLENEGYDNFKQTLNLKYFNFVPVIISDQYIKLVLFWLMHPTMKIFQSKFKDYSAFKLGKNVDILTRFIGSGRIFYKLFVSMLWEYTKHIDKDNLLSRISEPLEGNPFKIYYKGNLVSQDLCNSIIEYYSIDEGLKKGDDNFLNIAELGAGYGRLAYVFLKTHKCKYTIFDIPPALYIAERYLDSVFPELRVFKFRDFDSYNEIKEEYERADICFFTPEQMVRLPEHQYNLFINISSLHEMTMPQIQNYINLIDRYTVGYFYMKQWFKSINPHDGITISYEDYPIPNTWRMMYSRRCSIQSKFFEEMYQIGL